MSSKPAIQNYAFIDGQNLNQGIQSLGWRLDFKKFRIYLKDKYQITKVYYFVGYLAKNEPLYDFLKKAGFVLIFKPTLERSNGAVKGNCDAELVLQAMIEYSRYDKAVIVTGDGDFTCLIDYLRYKGKLAMVLIPNENRYSSLIRRATQGRYRAFISDLRPRLSYIKMKRTP
jgi:uncharacterized LabA/DUF88 family protein